MAILVACPGLRLPLAQPTNRRSASLRFGPASTTPGSSSASPRWPPRWECTSQRPRASPGCWSGQACSPARAAGSGLASVQPAMEKLSQQTGETVNLAVPDGEHVLNVAEVPSTFLLNSSGGWIGRRTMPHAVANRKVLMADGGLGVAEDLERYTAKTITDHDALNAELAAVRRNGYATAVAELEEELVAVASPVFGGTGACVAALSVSGPAFRMQPESLEKLGRLCAAA